MQGPISDPDAVVAAIVDDRSIADPFSGSVLVRVAGRLILAARGLADRERGIANRPDTPHNTASLTKLVTAVGVARLVDRGDLDLAAPVGRWLAGRLRPAMAGLSIEQLLLHLGGLPEQVPDVEGSDPITGDWLAGLADVEPDLAPSAGWCYSNVGYAIVGAVVERVTGVPFGDAMRALVFDPAEMLETGFFDTTVADGRRSLGYLEARPGSERSAIDNRGAGLGSGAPYGYATSTVIDLDRLLHALRAGRLIGPALAAAILNGRTPTGTAGRTAGFGLFVERHHRQRVTTSAGAGPGISAWLDDAPAAGYRAIVLSNAPKPAAHRVGGDLRAQLLG